ncbi:hypothetical protein B0H12DRAFT_1091536, partial [Mycena haematopus]
HQQICAQQISACDDPEADTIITRSLHAGNAADTGSSRAQQSSAHSSSLAELATYTSAGAPHDDGERNILQDTTYIECRKLKARERGRGRDDGTALALGQRSR